MSALDWFSLAFYTLAVMYGLEMRWAAARARQHADEWRALYQSTRDHHEKMFDRLTSIIDTVTVRCRWCGAESVYRDRCSACLEPLT